MRLTWKGWLVLPLVIPVVLWMKLLQAVIEAFDWVEERWL